MSIQSEPCVVRVTRDRCGLIAGGWLAKVSVYKHYDLHPTLCRYETTIVWRIRRSAACRAARGLYEKGERRRTEIDERQWEDC